MSKESSSGCVWLFIIVLFLGMIMWLVGAALWLLQFILPVVGLLIAIGLAIDAWSRVKQGKEAARLQELGRTELLGIAHEAEYRLSEVLSKWDTVSRTMGVGTIYAEAFSTGEATPELVELRADLTKAQGVADRLRAAQSSLDEEEIIDAIGDADDLWASLTERYWGSTAEE
nr:hypothetical protein [Corynebacterium lactis]